MENNEFTSANVATSIAAATVLSQLATLNVYVQALQQTADAQRATWQHAGTLRHVSSQLQDLINHFELK